MAVDLFSLRMNIETSGLGAATAGLREVDAAGKQAALSATNFANAWEGAKIKFAGTAAEMAVFKQSFSTGFFNEKMIAGMSMSGQDAAKAGEGMAKWNAGLAAMRVQNEEQVRSMGPLATMLTHMAALYAGFEVLHFVHGTIEAAGALHELSQRTGATVETLSVLKFAGAQAEVGAAQIAIGFRGMALSLGNLRDGVPKTVEAYQRLGFSFRDLATLSPDQQFIKLATAVGKMPEGYERAEVAQRVFGRSGAALLPLLVDLADKGFGKLREEAEQGGGLFSTEMATKADNFGDAVTRLTAAIRGLAINGLTPVLPLLTSFVDLMSKGAGFFADTFEKPSIDMLKRRGESLRPKHTEMFGVDIPDGTRSDPGGFRGDALGTGTRATLVGVAQLDKETAEFVAKMKEDERRAAEKAKRDKEAANQALMVAAGFGGPQWKTTVSAPDKLAFQGVAATHLALRGGSVGALHGGTFSSSSGEDLSGSLGGDLSTLFEQGGDGKTQAGRMSILAAFAREAKRGAVALKVQFAQIGTQLGTTLADGFATAISAGIRGKNVFKAFGNVIMSGLGSIMGQMGHAMIQQGIILMHLLPFLSNPFSSGPALIAAGIALSALGSTLGGIAGGRGGGSGGGGGRDNFGDHTTNITLTPQGAGGHTAPAGMGGMTPIEVIGIDSPRGTAALSKGMAATKRRNM
jgi:hypothetical protein